MASHQKHNTLIHVTSDTCRDHHALQPNLLLLLLLDLVDPMVGETEAPHDIYFNSQSSEAHVQRDSITS